MKTLGLERLGKCYILMDQPEKRNIVEKQLLVHFDMQEKRLSPPVLPVPQCMAYRGPHMLTEAFSGANVQRTKLNCVALNVYGQCAVCNFIKNNEQ